MNRLLDILLSRWEKKQLAHFYILRPPILSPDPAKHLHLFITQFILKITQLELRHNYTSLQELNHPDILLINPEKTHYLKDDFAPFFDFLTLAPYQLQWRFLIVYDAQKIKTPILNKLLKSLEEPPSHTTIFFLLPNQYKILSTVESRSITFTIPEENLPSLLDPNQTQKSLPTNLHQAIIQFNQNKLPLNNLIDQLILHKDHLDIALKMIIQHISTSPTVTYQQMNKILYEYQWFQTSKIFHNNLSERLFGILHAAVPLKE